MVVAVVVVRKKWWSGIRSALMIGGWTVVGAKGVE